MTGQMAASRTCEAYAQCVRQAQDRDHLRLFQLRTVTDKCAAVAAMCDLHLGHISPRAQLGRLGSCSSGSEATWRTPHRVPVCVSMRSRAGRHHSGCPPRTQTPSGIPLVRSGHVRECTACMECMRTGVLVAALPCDLLPTQAVIATACHAVELSSRLSRLEHAAGLHPHPPLLKKHQCSPRVAACLLRVPFAACTPSRRSQSAVRRGIVKHALSR